MQRKSSTCTNKPHSAERGISSLHYLLRQDVASQLKDNLAYVGKLKTAAQMAAIPLLLYNAPLMSIDIRALGSVLIYIAAALTLWSMGYYLHRAIPLLTADQGR